MSENVLDTQYQFCQIERQVSANERGRETGNPPAPCVFFWLAASSAGALSADRALRGGQLPEGWRSEALLAGAPHKVGELRRCRWTKA